MRPKPNRRGGVAPAQLENNMTIHRIPDGNDIVARIQDDILAAVKESLDFHIASMADATGEVIIKRDGRLFKIELHEII